MSAGKRKTSIRDVMRKDKEEELQDLQQSIADTQKRPASDERDRSLDRLDAERHAVRTAIARLRKPFAWRGPPEAFALYAKAVMERAELSFQKDLRLRAMSTATRESMHAWAQAQLRAPDDAARIDRANAVVEGNMARLVAHARTEISGDVGVAAATEIQEAVDAIFLRFMQLGYARADMQIERTPYELKLIDEGAVEFMEMMGELLEEVGQGLGWTRLSGADREAGADEAVPRQRQASEIRQRQASSERSESEMIAEMGRLSLEIDNLKNIKIRELMLTDKQTALRKLDALIAKTGNRPAGDEYLALLVAKRGALRSGINELLQPLVWEGSADDCKRYVEYVFERAEIAMKKDRGIGKMARSLALSKDEVQRMALSHRQNAVTPTTYTSDNWKNKKISHDGVTIALLTSDISRKKKLALAYADVPVSCAFDVAVPKAIQEPVDELLHQFMTLARDRVAFAGARSGPADAQHIDAVAFTLVKALGDHMLAVARAGGVGARDLAAAAARSKRPEVQEKVTAEHLRDMSAAGIPVGE